MNRSEPLPVHFFRTATGNEPVREWLQNQDREDRKKIGEDLKTVQFAWPIGMPLVRNLGGGLWEVRTQLRDRIARVFFAQYDQHIVLLHAIIKKSRQSPPDELALARQRLGILRGRRL